MFVAPIACFAKFYFTKTLEWVDVILYMKLMHSHSCSYCVCAHACCHALCLSGRRSFGMRGGPYLCICVSSQLSGPFNVFVQTYKMGTAIITLTKKLDLCCTVFNFSISSPSVKNSIFLARQTFFVKLWNLTLLWRCVVLTVCFSFFL